jgi:hypothetical protein
VLSAVEHTPRFLHRLELFRIGHAEARDVGRARVVHHRLQVHFHVALATHLSRGVRIGLRDGLQQRFELRVVDMRVAGDLRGSRAGRIGAGLLVKLGLIGLQLLAVEQRTVDGIGNAGRAAQRRGVVERGGHQNSFPTAVCTLLLFASAASAPVMSLIAPTEAAPPASAAPDLAEP